MKFRRFNKREVRHRANGIKTISSRKFPPLPKFFREKRGGWWRRWLRRIGITAAIFFAVMIAYAWIFLPDVDEAAQLIFEESTVIYDRGALDPEEKPENHVLYIIHGDENREFVPLDEISPWVRKATVAIEDDRFYRHFGFDIGGILKATMYEVFGIGERRGGSTITQQLVKNTFLSQERTFTRKFKEILLSIKMELAYSKDEILEMYLNKIPYGSNSHGIEAASKTFFGKSSRDLTLAEASVLTSLPVAPTRFSPYGSNKDLLLGFYEYDENSSERMYKKGRKDLVLERLLDTHKITFEDFKTAFSESKELEFKQNRTDIRAPHFVFHVREQLENKYGKDFLKYGGLQIFTTLDPELQRIAEETIAVKTPHYESTYGARNVALATIDPENGEVLAYVGGKDYFDEAHDGQVDVLASRRQPGSSFKPIVYAAGFEKGYSPSTVLFDVETDFGANYIPQNFDGEFVGPIAVRDALNRSVNIPAVKMAYLATPKKIFEISEKIGIKIEGSPEDHGVAIGIGVAEIEPLSHISAYQVFARDGSWYEPTTILKIENSEGKILENFDPTKTLRDGLDPEISALVRNILTDETTRPTTDDFDWNKLLQLEEWDNGAKTGTSNRNVENPDFDPTKPEDEDENPQKITAPGDSWTIGFTPHLVTGVWVGNNRGEPMKPGATGLAVAAPIWKRFMLDAHELLVENGADPEKKYPNVPLETRKINKFSGKLATDETPRQLVKEEVFASFAVPIELDDSVKKVDVNKYTGRVATNLTPFYSREKKSVLNLKSIRPNMPNWNEPVKEWLDEHPRFLTSLGLSFEETETPEMGRDPEMTLTDRTERRTSWSRVPRNVEKTTANAPKISISSPKNGGAIAPGTVEIVVNANSKSGIREVEFYFDNDLITYATYAPWSRKINIPGKVTPGTKHTITTVAVDKLFRTSSATIEVSIARDTNGPNIVFLGPLPNQKIPINSNVHWLLDVQDFESGVKVVEFLVNDVSLGHDDTPPFEKSFVAPDHIGRKTLTARAWDMHGNRTEKSVPIQLEREKIILSTTIEISSVKMYRQSISVDVVVPNAENYDWIELTATQADAEIFTQRIESPAKFAVFQIPRNFAGETRIQLFAKPHGEASDRFSEKWTEL
ncbi:penicillin-binding protein [bacterium]|jgi:membrane peptidoglycan carboxypeptidase|nr:penicillin-binding protein [bacterium]MBT6831476.1 penicillin-binding protein [bacterium]MBT6996501.1 penicillin-binding protein [bacterium]MBT7772709.1 penicillin-binding protein [bacterium]